MTDRTTTASYLALGSNIDPVNHLGRCLHLLAQMPSSTLGARSSWYRTRPWGLEEQPDFLNLVIEIETQLSPLALLHQTQSIEQALHRERIVKNGPRTIDIDILLHGATVLDEPALKVPHPGLLERDFMLLPLIEIAPQARHPVLERPVSRLTEHVLYHQILDTLTTPPR